ncbi:MAG: nuclear pore complex subunit [Bacteroidetes bacterium]|nr:MAG: nuclear pore complex subunit [Bacteroidota bacterium]
MESLKIKESKNHPEIDFNVSNGSLSITGKSIPEDTLRFYTPIKDWVKEYTSAPADETTVELKFEYLNSSSNKCILDILEILYNGISGDKKLKVNWYYSEEDILEDGEFLDTIAKIPFNFIEYEDEDEEFEL